VAHGRKLGSALVWGSHRQARSPRQVTRIARCPTLPRFEIEESGAATPPDGDRLIASRSATVARVEGRPRTADPAGTAGPSWRASLARRPGSAAVDRFLARHASELRPLADRTAALFVLEHALETATHAIAFYRPEGLAEDRAIAATVDLVYRFLAPAGTTDVDPPTDTAIDRTGTPRQRVSSGNTRS
jgi:hypothetical protein